jgi:co-chaperonin GroES (HSP10)
MTQTETTTTDCPYPKVDVRDFRKARFLTDKLLLRQYPPEETTEGGILLSNVAKDMRKAEMARYWIEAVGEQVQPAMGMKLTFRCGDTVVCPKVFVQEQPEFGDGLFTVSAKDVDWVFAKE